jgi:hypothetical protein
VDAHVLLADFAQTDGSGKVTAIGLGWSVISTPTPHHAVVVMLRVRWDEANMKHRLQLRLLTPADENTVTVPTPSGPQPLGVEAEFEVGRPENLPAGSTIDHAFAINIGPGIALEPGRYEWRLQIGDREEDWWRAPFSVVGAPPG